MGRHFLGYYSGLAALDTAPQDSFNFKETSKFSRVRHVRGYYPEGVAQRFSCVSPWRRRRLQIGLVSLETSERYRTCLAFFNPYEAYLRSGEV
jgi:hypothetical protein